MKIQIENLKDLTPADKASLRLKHVVDTGGSRLVHTIEDLWIAMADNPEFIASLGLADDTDKRRVLEALARVASRQSKELTKSWFAAHVADLIVVIVIVSSLTYVLWVNQIQAFIKDSELFAIGPRYVVVAPNGIPPYHIINESDVGMTDGSKPTTLNAFTGRYSNEEIPRGFFIDPAKLSPGMRLSGFEGFAIFEVKLQPTVMFAGLKLPTKINVLASPRVKDLKVLTFEAYLLNIDPQKDGPSAVLAATQADFSAIAPTLPQSAFFVVGPLH